jgi:hypothetical protein
MEPLRHKDGSVAYVTVSDPRWTPALPCMDYQR